MVLLYVDRRSHVLFTICLISVLVRFILGVLSCAFCMRIVGCRVVCVRILFVFVYVALHGVFMRCVVVYGLLGYVGVLCCSLCVKLYSALFYLLRLLIVGWT